MANFGETFANSFSSAYQMAKEIAAKKLKDKRDEELENSRLDLDKSKLEFEKYKYEQDLKNNPFSKMDKEVANRATTLRKEFNASQVTKDFQTINRAGKALKSAYDASVKGDTASLIASDQALGVLFQKMLDPISVVRESEYARTPQGAAFLNRLESIVPQMVKGGLRLTNDDRKAIYQQAMELVDSSASSYNENIDRYENLSKMYQVPPEMIFGGIGRIESNVKKDVTVKDARDVPPEVAAIGQQLGVKIKSFKIRDSK